MSIEVEVQQALSADAVDSLPGDEEIRCWVQTALLVAGYGAADNRQVVVRIVDREEVTLLNRDYRHKDAVTNVLSFPFEVPQGIPGEELLPLGDIVVCAAVVAQEALEQGKPALHHWAHMIIHGALHLLGYDHMSEAEASEMEALEIRTLAELGFPDPYVVDDQNLETNTSVKTS